MAVRPESLETPERGLVLENRTPDTFAATPPGEPEQPASPEEELLALKRRIAEARRVAPGPAGLHCRDCFSRGRDAVLEFLEGR